MFITQPPKIRQKVSSAHKNHYPAIKIYQIIQKTLHLSIKSSYLCSGQRKQDMETISYNFDLGKTENVTLPSFTSSISITRDKPAPVWIRIREAVAFLRRKGTPYSDQTLYNMARDGRLSSRRNGPRFLEFDLNELAALADSQKS